MSPYQHFPCAYGLYRRNEVYFRAGRKELLSILLWESGAYGDPVMHSCISAGFSRRKAVCICLLAAEGGCSSFWVDIESWNCGEVTPRHHLAHWFVQGRITKVSDDRHLSRLKTLLMKLWRYKLARQIKFQCFSIRIFLNLLYINSCSTFNEHRILSTLLLPTAKFHVFENGCKPLFTVTS